MLSIFGDLRNANQNNSEIPPFPSKNGYNQELKNDECLQDCGGKEVVYIVGINVD